MPFTAEVLEAIAAISEPEVLAVPSKSKTVEPEPPPAEEDDNDADSEA